MDNVGFIVAAYTVTFIVLAGYTLSLWRRLRRARQNRPADLKR